MHRAESPVQLSTLKCHWNQQDINVFNSLCWIRAIIFNHNSTCNKAKLLTTDGSGCREWSSHQTIAGFPPPCVLKLCKSPNDDTSLLCVVKAGLQPWVCEGKLLWKLRWLLWAPDVGLCSPFPSELAQPSQKNAVLGRVKWQDDVVCCDSCIPFRLN